MKKNTPRKKEESLEELYREILLTIPRGPFWKETYEGTLEQPHTDQFIETVTTYGAYQKPI